MSIYKIFRESAMDTTREQTEGLQCLKLTFTLLDHAVALHNNAILNRHFYAVRDFCCKWGMGN